MEIRILIFLDMNLVMHLLDPRINSSFGFIISQTFVETIRGIAVFLLLLIYWH